MTQQPAAQRICTARGPACRWLGSRRTLCCQGRPVLLDQALGQRNQALAGVLVGQQALVREVRASQPEQVPCTARPGSAPAGQPLQCVRVTRLPQLRLQCAAGACRTPTCVQSAFQHCPRSRQRQHTASEQGSRSPIAGNSIIPKNQGLLMPGTSANMTWQSLRSMSMRSLCSVGTSARGVCACKSILQASTSAKPLEVQQALGAPFFLVPLNPKSVSFPAPKQQPGCMHLSPAPQVRTP